MENRKSRTRLITHLTVILIGLVIATIPIAFLLVSYNSTVNTIEAEAEINARIISAIINANPEYWEFEQARLEEYLARRPKKEFPETRRIVNTINEIIAEKADKLESPIVMQSAELVDSGVVVGKVEIERSLRPVLEKAALLAFVVFPIGLGLFLTFRIFLIRRMHLTEKALWYSEELYRTVVEQTHDAIFIYRGTQFIFVNNRTSEITGYSKEELHTMNLWDLVHPEDREHNIKTVQNRTQGEGAPSVYEVRIVTKNSKIKHLELAVSRISYEGGYASLCAVRDITDRKEAERAMDTIVTSIVGVTGQECLDRITKNIADWLSADCVIIGEIMADGKEAKAVSMMFDGKKITDYTYVLANTPCDDVAHKGFCLFPENVREIFPEANDLREPPIEGYLGTPLRNPDGTAMGVLCALFRSPVKTVPSLRKIMDILASKASAEIGRMRSDKIIATSLHEKEILLKEIHHRVKNNLTVISSILSLQAGAIDDKKAQEILKECQHRVHTMAMIHTKLYKSKDLAHINFNEYIRELTYDLSLSYRVNPKTTIHVHADDIYLDINTTIPLSLILNELISNSLKHAFPEEGEGEIRVAFQHEDGTLTLTIADNGIGFPEHIDFCKTESLGMQLVIALTEQLDGTIEMKRGEGTEFRIVFKTTK